MLYTVVPFIMIGVLFFFTARDENYIDKLSARPDVTVSVTGFQWSWQFQYRDYPVPGSPTGVVTMNGEPWTPETGSSRLPLLVIPEHRTVRFNLYSTDVVHPFWIVPFRADGIQAWSILYAYDNDVAVDVSLFSRGKGKNGWSGKTFTLELKRYAAHPGQWLVASWVPKGIGGGGTLSPNRRSGPPPPPVKAKLSPTFLLVPALFLVTLLVGLGLWAVRSIVRGRRATRRYAEALGYNSSSNPS